MRATLSTLIDAITPAADEKLFAVTEDGPAILIMLKGPEDLILKEQVFSAANKVRPVQAQVEIVFVGGHS